MQWKMVLSLIRAVGIIEAKVSLLERNGGAAGTRTPYLFNAIEALSQMSYSPTQMDDNWLDCQLSSISIANLLGRFNNI